MTDETAGNGQTGSGPTDSGQPQSGQPSGYQSVPPPGATHRPPFPAIRLLYAIGFAVVAWFVFWITMILALIQFVVVAINGKINDELRDFCICLVQYLWELLAFITFVRDEQPFPIGPFPKRN